MAKMVKGSPKNQRPILIEKTTPPIQKKINRFGPAINDGVVKNPIYCVATLFYSFKHTTCVASLAKKRYALVIEFFDPSNINWAI